MIDLNFAGVLAGITRYGVPWHGPIESGQLTPPAGPALTWLQPQSTACWAIRHPGVSVDPYAGAPLARAQDAASGRELTSWAILSGWGDVHGKRLPSFGGTESRSWIWVDDSGHACACSFKVLNGTVVASAPIPDPSGGAGTLDIPQYRFDQPITVRLLFRRFGDLRENGTPAAALRTRDYIIPAGALGQIPISGSLLPDHGTLLVESFSRDGAKIALSVVSGGDRLAGGLIRRPLGFIELVLSGTAESPQIAHGLLADRATTLGSAANYNVVTETIDYSSTSHADGGGGAVLDSATWTATSGGVYNISLAGRLIAAEYDNTGTVVFAALAISENATEYSENSGTLSAGASVTSNTDANATISIAWGSSVSIARDAIVTVASHVAPSGDPDSYTADTTISVTDRPDNVSHEVSPPAGMNYSNSLLSIAYGPDNFSTTTTTDHSMNAAELEYWSWEARATGQMFFVRMNENVLGLGIEEIGVVRVIRLIGRLSTSSAQSLVNPLQNYFNGPYPALSVNYCVQHPISGGLYWPLSRPRAYT